MEMLFNIAKELYESLERNQDSLSVVKQADFNYKKESIGKKSEIESRVYLANNLDYVILLDKMKWGQLVNMDLLADFLNEIVYKNIPNGSYLQNKDEVALIKEYDEEKRQRIFKTFFTASFISAFINYFITYVRQNYDINFMNRFNSYENRDIVNQQEIMNHVCSKLLKSGDYCYSGDLKTADKVFDFINEEENCKRDRLSYFIDSTEFSDVCVKEYEIFLSEINNFLNIVNIKRNNIENNRENQIYLEFAMKLKEYINSRIESLSKNTSNQKIR